MDITLDTYTTLRPIVERLERALGKNLYYFRDLDEEYGDDYGHRFLVLYCCCLYQPKSAYVQFLLEASGAEDVDALKAALIDPENYRHPFEMNYSSCDDYEALGCRVRYLSPTARRVVGIVFTSLAARATAERQLTELIDAEVWIVAPGDLAPVDWIKTATRHCRDWIHRYLYADNLDDPIEFLACLDELCVIADGVGPRRGPGLGVSPSIEDLLWYAHILKVPMQLLYSDGKGLGNPESCLERSTVPARVAEQTRRREDFTRQLTELRLDHEDIDLGLRNGEGRSVRCDDLAIPFDLVRRLVAWQADFEQADYDNGLNQPATVDVVWWARHDQETAEIAQALRDALGTGTRILFNQDAHWQAIGGSDA